MFNIEINQRWGKKISEKWIDKIIKSALKMAGVKAAEISVAFVGETKIKELNRRYRGKNKITDVLSFTYQIQNAKYKIPLIGEIILCYPRTVRQARQNFAPRNLGGERGHGVQQEIKMLLAHGLLHLCGFDHEGSLREARRMENLQNKIVRLCSV